MRKWSNCINDLIYVDDVLHTGWYHERRSKLTSRVPDVIDRGFIQHKKGKKKRENGHNAWTVLNILMIFRTIDTIYI